MYQEYYQLKADPFRLSPDHTFCFQYPSFAKAKASMQYALEAAEGFVTVTGSPGMGKSTLINDLLSDSDFRRSDHLTATLVNTQLEASNLLRMVAYDFGLEVEDLDNATVLEKLKRLFLDARQSRRVPLLIVDEAQRLSPSALEELCLLTNIQVENKPCLQIFLVGQQEFQKQLRAPILEQLRQRITAVCYLDHLTLEQTAAYIKHRLGVAGWNNKPEIALGVFPVIHQACGGIPRRINQFCSRLLLYGSLEEKFKLTTEDAQIVFDELRDEYPSETESSSRGDLENSDPTEDQSDPTLSDEFTPVSDHESLLETAEIRMLQQEMIKSFLNPEPRQLDQRKSDTESGQNVFGIGINSRRTFPPETNKLFAVPDDLAERRRRDVRAESIDLRQDQGYREPWPEFASASGHDWLRETAEIPLLHQEMSNARRAPVIRLQESELKTQAGQRTAVRIGTTPDRPATRAAEAFVSVPRDLAEQHRRDIHDEVNRVAPLSRWQMFTFGSALTLILTLSWFFLPDNYFAIGLSDDPEILSADASHTAPSVQLQGLNSDHPPLSGDQNEVTFDQNPAGVQVQAPAEPKPQVITQPQVVKQISFEFDSTEITPKDRDLLNEVAANLKESNYWMAHIVGYTDNVGPQSYNQYLSRLRADTVAQYLTQQGISSDRMRIEGRGSDTQATHPELSPDEQRPARLVQIVLEPVSDNF